MTLKLKAMVVPASHDYITHWDIKTATITWYICYPGIKQNPTFYRWITVLKFVLAGRNLKKNSKVFEFCNDYTPCHLQKLLPEFHWIKKSVSKHNFTLSALHISFDWPNSRITRLLQLNVNFYSPQPKHCSSFENPLTT